MAFRPMTYTLPKTEEKSVYVEQMFNKIAQKYDLFNDIITFGMHRQWKRFVAVSYTHLTLPTNREV